MSELEQLRSALAKIAKIADSASGESEAHSVLDVGCTIKSLPKRLLVKGAETARSINPINAPSMSPMAGLDASIMDAARIAVLTTKYWGPQPRRLTVSFMESTPADLRARIIAHLNAWARTSGVTFVATGGVGQVRISRGAGGYWSYLGTDVLRIPTNRPTMNLERFTMNTPESEFKRVIRHEAGHTLGFPHEHMRSEIVARIDPQKAYIYFWETQRWDRATVDAQVLTPLANNSIYATQADQTSIMCYQLPGRITRDGRPIVGGTDINATDYAFAGRIYPIARNSEIGQRGLEESCASNDEPSATTVDDDWSEDEDVEPSID